ncbi:MAG: DUF11 domain-containing protein, partial [Acidobacteria bacterium]
LLEGASGIVAPGDAYATLYRFDSVLIDGSARVVVDGEAELGALEVRDGELVLDGIPTPDLGTPVLRPQKTIELLADHDGDGRISGNDFVLYRVRIENAGDGAATGVVLVDPPPPGTSFFHGGVTTSQGVISRENPVIVELGRIDPGASATVTIQAWIRWTTPGVRISNQGTVTYAQAPGVSIPTDDPALPGEADPTDVVLDPPELRASLSAELALDRSGDGTPNAGDRLRFTAVIDNVGLSSASNVVLNLPLPAGTSRVPGSESPPASDASPAELEIPLGELAVQGQLTASFELEIDAGLSSPEVIAQGTVRSDETLAVLTDDPAQPGSSDPTVVPLALLPNLRVEKRALLADGSEASGRAGVGSVVRYVLRVENAGSAPAAGLALSDPLAPALRFVSGSLSSSQGALLGGEPRSGETLRVDLGELAPLGVAEVSFEAVVVAPAGGVPPVVLNQAVATSDALPPVASDDPAQGGFFDPTAVALAPGAVLGGTAWYDLNLNGLRDETAGGLGGIVVELRDDGGRLLATARSAADGSFRFAGVAAGTYALAPRLDAAALHSTTAVPLAAASDGRTDRTDLLLGIAAVVGGSGVGEVRVTAWNDRDADGGREAEEGAIDGVGVELTGDLDGDGAAELGLAAATVGGSARFAALPAGRYRASVRPESLPPGFTEPTFDSDGLSTPHAAEAELLAGQQLELLFGYTGASTDAVLGGRVWNDVDADGIQDAGEPGFAGIQIAIQRDNVTVATPVTDADGRYRVEPLASGTYVVTLLTPPLDSFATVDPDGVVEPLSLHTARVPLRLGERNLGADFGYVIFDGLFFQMLAQVSGPQPVPGAVQPGSRINYQSLAVNFTGGDLGSATIRNPLPAGTALVPGTITVMENLFCAPSTTPAAPPSAARDRSAAGASAVLRATPAKAVVVSEDPLVIDLGSLPHCHGVLVSYDVVVDDPLDPAITEIVNQAELSADGVPPLPSDDNATPRFGDPTILPVSTRPGFLLFTKDGGLIEDPSGDGLAQPGDGVRFTVSVRNTSIQASVAAAVLEDPLPAGFVPAPEGPVIRYGGDCGVPPADESTGELVPPDGRPPAVLTGLDPLRLELGELPPCSSIAVVIDGRIDAALPPTLTELSNRARLFFDGGTVLSDGPGAGLTDPVVIPVDPGLIDGPPLPPQPPAPVILFTDRVRTASGGPAQVGEVLSFELVLRNDGARPLEDAVLIDPLPPGTSLEAESLELSRSRGCDVAQPVLPAAVLLSEQPLSLQIGTLEPCENLEVRFRARLETASDAILVEQALLAFSGGRTVSDDPASPGENEPTLIPVDLPRPRIRALKTDSLALDADGDGVPSPGDVVAYRLVVENRGTAVASEVMVVDPTPANARFEAGSASTSRGSVLGEDPLRVELGDLAPGDVATVELAVRIAAALPPEVTSITNQAMVESAELAAVASDDPELGGSADPTTTPLRRAPLLRAEKTVTLAADRDGDAVVSAGDELGYALRVINRGSVAATGVVLIDPLPAEGTLVAGSASTSQGTIGGGAVLRADLGTLAAGAEATVTFRLRLADVLAEEVVAITNQATVESAELAAVASDDPALPGAADPTRAPLGARPLLAVEKVDRLYDDVGQDGIASPGDVLLYRITVTNAGSIAATQVNLRDPLPSEVSLIAGSLHASQGSAVSEEGLEVDLGSLLAGASASVTFQVRIDPDLDPAVQMLRNQAVVQSAVTAPVLSDDPDLPGSAEPTETSLIASPRLVLSKVADLEQDADGDGVLSPGDRLRYTLSLVNAGTARASGLVLIDPIPQHTTLVPGSLITSQGLFDGLSPLRLSLGTLQPGASATVSFAVRVDDPLTAPSVSALVNQAILQSRELDDVLSDDPAQPGAADPTRSAVVATPVLAARKTAAPAVDLSGGGQAIPGEVLSYRIEVENLGDAPASGVELIDPIPAHTTLLPAS